MKRDFSASSKQALLDLVAQVKAEEWCGLTDAIGDCWYTFSSWIGLLNVNNYLDDITTYQKKVIDKNDTTASDIESIFVDVYAVNGIYKEKLDAILEELQAYRAMVGQFSDAINPTNGLFSDSVIVNLTEAMITYATDSDTRTSFVEKEINPAFDDEGSYGGSQAEAARYTVGSEEFVEIATVIRQYDAYSAYSDQEIAELLVTMNDTGCGYISLVNTIFVRFVGREDLFEETFGYPMYDDDGELNYSLIFADLYCSAGSEKGVTSLVFSKIWESFCEEHGVYVDVKYVISVNESNIDELLLQGQIIVLMSNFNLENEAGQIKYSDVGGHAMTVLGFSEDGRLIVSSWGKQYYITTDDTFGALYYLVDYYQD